MTLLNYAMYEGVTAREALTYFRTFATATCGWTEVEYRDNCGWSTGWIAGSDTYLELYSKGFSDFNLHARIRAGIDDIYDCWWYKIIDPAIFDYSTVISKHPVWQNSILPDNFSGRTSSSSSSTYGLVNVPTTIPKVWFFGDYYYLAVHFQVTDDKCWSIAFGLPLLNVDFRSGWVDIHDFVWCGWGQRFIYTGGSAWNYTSDISDLYAFGNLYQRGTTGSRFVAYWNGVGAYYDRLATGAYLSNYNSSQLGSHFLTYYKSVAKNSYADNDRMLRKNHYAVIEGTMKIIGESPNYMCKHNGLDIGAKITKGAKEYLVFPASHRINSNYGIAYRIA